jgi:hypothetical protein
MENVEGDEEREVKLDADDGEDEFDLWPRASRPASITSS